MLIAQQLITNSSKNLGKSAIRYLGKESSYQSLRDSIGRLSYLFHHEIGTGQRVAFIARNSPAYIESFFALTNIRSTCIPVDPDLPPVDVVKWLKESKATHVAVTGDLLGRTREILNSEKLSLPIIEIEKKHGGEYDPSYTPPPDHQPNESDIILVIRTQGTTGKPKYVNFTHKQLSHATIAMRSHYRLLPTDRFITTMSWSHPFAMLHGMLFPLMMGATLVIDHGLQAVEWLDFILDSKVSRIVHTPQFFLKLLITCKNEKRLLPGTKSITVGCGSLEPGVKKSFDLLKIPALHVYGQAENLWTVAMEEVPSAEAGPPSGEYERGIVGKGLPGLKYKVMDDNGDEIEGEGRRLGQLALTGPTVMNGYLDKEKETKDRLRGTWLYTGDLVELEGKNEELRMKFIGRKEDVLRTDGEPVSLLQADQVLRSMPQIQDGAAVVVKNSKGHPVVICAVVKKPTGLLNEKQVLEFCASKLPPNICPMAVGFTDVIPRDIGGNVNATRLRLQFSSLAG